MAKLFTMPSSIATETIHYQTGDTFPLKMSSLVSKILADDYDTNKSLLANSKYVKELLDLIRKRFNMTIDIDPNLSEYYEAAIMPTLGPHQQDISNLTKSQAIDVSKLFTMFSSPDEIKKTIEYEKIYEKFEKYRITNEGILQKLNNRKGSIDLKHAKLGGYFSFLQNHLLINFKALEHAGLNADEITAVILHEVGHIFHGMETHHLIESSNRTIQQITKEINNNNIDRAEHIFKTKFANEEEFDKYMQSKKTKLDLTSHVALVYVGKINTQMVNGTYDQVSFENLADEFVSRFGFGVHVVTGLNKLYTRYGMVSTTGFLYTTINILAIFTYLLLLLVSPPIAIIYFILSIVLFSYDRKQMVYDFPIERYNRVKNSVINNLKNPKLPTPLTKNLLHQFDLLDTIITESHQFKSITEKAYDLITFSGRSDSYYMRLQQEIETGLNNALFISAARVKTT